MEGKSRSALSFDCLGQVAYGGQSIGYPDLALLLLFLDLIAYVVGGGQSVGFKDVGRHAAILSFCLLLSLDYYNLTAILIFIINFQLDLASFNFILYSLNYPINFDQSVF